MKKYRLVLEPQPTRDQQENVVVNRIATYLGFSPHDCEAWYKCPLCGKSFGDFSVDMKDVRCPHCKEKLEGIR